MDRRVVQRLCLGRTVRVVTEDAGGMVLDADARLCPGREVDVVFTTMAEVPGRPPRRALVWSWRLVGVGSDGPRYHGYCRWV